MTNSFMNNQYPFGVIEEETKSAIGNNNGENRKSMSVHSNVSGDSFVSACDSPNAQKR